MSYRVFVAALCLCACGDSETQPQEVTLGFSYSLRGVDADGEGILRAKRNVDEATGNPWPAFEEAIANEFAFGIKEFEVLSLSMDLLDSSQGVQTLGEVFNGQVSLDMNVGGNEHSVGRGDLLQSNTSTRADSLVIEFDYATVAEADRERLHAGEFSLIFEGQSAATFQGSAGVAELVVELSLHALPATE